MSDCLFLSLSSEFLDTFDTIEKDGTVTPAEFIKYYGNVSSSIDEDDYFELMIRNAWHISGGEGWCANSSCRRVLATHADGHQSVQEIKNDLGMKDDDFESMVKNLEKQGIKDIAQIELASGHKYVVGKGAMTGVAAVFAPQTTTAAPAAATTAGDPGAVKDGKFDPRPSAAATTQFRGRRAPGGQSTISFG